MKNRFQIHRASLVVASALLIGLCGCKQAGTPTLTEGQGAIENSIKQESQGRIKLVKFEKTDGVHGESQGVPFYRLEFRSEIEFVADCQWGGGMAGSNLNFKAAKQQNARETNKQTDDSQNAEKLITVGQRASVSGVVHFTKKENGWSADAVEIKTVKTLEQREYLERAEKGDANAQWNLCSMIIDERNISNLNARNFEEAMKWCQKAADQGYPNAQLEIAYAYARGNSPLIHKDQTQALEWLRKAANSGQRKAQFMLGLACMGDNELFNGNWTGGETLKNLHVTQDKAEGLNWLGKSADQNNDEAQLLLGLIYATGSGANTNMALAEEWLKKATLNGNERAKEAIDWFHPTPEQKLARTRSACRENLKAIGMALKVWAGDHRDEYPFALDNKSGGTREQCARLPDGSDANAAIHFRALSKELDSPATFVCPSDTSKKPASSFEQLKAENVSYILFTGPEIGDTYPEHVVARCRLHGLYLLGDGAVLQQAPPAKK